MDIHLRPDQELAVQEALRAGLIKNEIDALDIGLESLRSRLTKIVTQVSREDFPLEKRNNLVELFDSVRCDDLDFSRNKSTGRTVDL